MPTPPKPSSEAPAPAADKPDDRREKRYSARRKTELVLRILRGESLDAVSRETGLPVSRLSGWRDEFLDGGEAALKSRTTDAGDAIADEERRALQAKVGEITMDNELLRAKIAKLEAGLPPALRRSRR